MRRFGLPVAITAVLAVAGACKTGSLDLSGFSSATTGTPTPTSTPGPVDALVAYGNGHNGDLTLTGPLSNVCHPVQGAPLGTTTAIVDSAAGFTVGDAVLFWQVRDDFSALVFGDTSDVSSAGAAGTFEIHRIANIITGNPAQLTLTSAFGVAFSSTGTRRAQACRIPEYANLHIAAAGQLTASKWDGLSGGLVAVFVSTAFTLNATVSIDADGAGFRGGAKQNNPGGNNLTDYTALDVPVSDVDAAGKGEGLDGRMDGRAGVGNLANGGGGANADCAGAGGGGNGGRGGGGGYEFQVVAPDGAEGIGAARITAAGILTPGGGGGGGQNDTGASFISDGGTGGGVVVIFAKSMAGTGTIRARGAAGFGTFNGGGGGGAGGFVGISSTGTYAGAIDVSGGVGANGADADCGPGGGGGGGVVVTSGMTIAGTVSVGGGANGTSSPNGARGATVGLPGTITSL